LETQAQDGVELEKDQIKELASRSLLETQLQEIELALKKYQL
jgi:hypothetical protein